MVTKIKHNMLDPVPLQPDVAETITANWLIEGVDLNNHCRIYFKDSDAAVTRKSGFIELNINFFSFGYVADDLSGVHDRRFQFDLTSGDAIFTKGSLKVLDPSGGTRYVATKDTTDLLIYNSQLQAMQMAINAASSEYNFIDGFADEFVDETNVDLTRSLGQTYNSTDDSYDTDNGGGTISDMVLHIGLEQNAYSLADSHTVMRHKVNSGSVFRNSDLQLYLGVEPYQTFTVNYTNDANSLIKAYHLSDGEQVILSVTGVDSLPAGLNAKTGYYVVNSVTGASGSFELSLTNGGSPIAMTSNGSGTLEYTRCSKASISYSNTTIDGATIYPTYIEFPVDGGDNNGLVYIIITDNLKDHSILALAGQWG